MLELDHVFVFDDRGGGDTHLFSLLREHGLQPTYMREHVGQGTANVCYAFDNAFLEILFLTGTAEEADPQVVRTGLWSRGQWKETGASRYGIAWRSTAEQPPVPCWDYVPSYLPVGMSIPVATFSDDLRQPMCFRSPGTAAPRDWPPERRNSLQEGRYTTISVELTQPDPAPGLRTLAEAGLFTLREAQPPGMRVTLARPEGPPVVLDL